MMTEQSFSFGDYLANLPADRKDSVERVWRVVRESIPKGYTEKISSKFLSFGVDGEMYVALASQKNYISLHLMPMYVFPELKAKLNAAGKKLKGGGKAASISQNPMICHLKQLRKQSVLVMPKLTKNKFSRLTTMQSCRRRNEVKTNGHNNRAI